MVANMKYVEKYGLFVFFIIFLLYFGVMTKINIAKSDIPTKTYEMKGKGIFEKDAILKQKIAANDDIYNSYFFQKIGFIENYGLLQKVLGKEIVDDKLNYRRVYKGANDTLYYTVPVKNINEKAVENISNLKHKLDLQQIPMFFVLAPNKHTINSANFPQGVLDYNTTNLDDLSKRLTEKGIDVLDLNQEFFKDKKDENTSFYKTDTHWKNETAFWGYQKLVSHLANEYVYNFNNDAKFTSPTSYTTMKYNETYIGSMGKRTGKKYVTKKDDYELILPTFDTNRTYKKYNDVLTEISTKSGSFEDVFVNKAVLDSKDSYEDKYTTMMGYGTPYEVIINNQIKQDTKLLIIKDSFAMPLSAYLSNNIKTICLLDTRYENIRKNLNRMITNIKPDYVLFVCSPSSVFYFPEMFDF